MASKFCCCPCWRQSEETLDERLIDENRTNRDSFFVYKSINPNDSDRIFRDYDRNAEDIKRMSLTSFPVDNDDDNYSIDSTDPEGQSNSTHLNYPQMDQKDDSDGEAEIRDSFATTSSSVTVIATTSTRTTLERTLRAQRLRTRTNDPGLAPRGPIIPSSSQHVNLPISTNTPFSRPSDIGASTFTADTDLSSYTVSVTRWAIRRQENQANADDAVTVNSDVSDFNVTTKTSTQPATNYVFTPPTAFSPTQSQSHSQGEVEFEIALAESETWQNVWQDTVAGGNGNGWGSSRPGNNRRAEVWRTARELLLLHTAMVAAMGDMAPRRPRLLTQTQSTIRGSNDSGGNPLDPSADLKHDMRTIAVFVKALLGQPACLSLRAVRAFLKLEDLIPLDELVFPKPQHPQSLSNLDYGSTTTAALDNSSQPTKLERADSFSAGAIHNSLGQQSLLSAQDKWRLVLTSLRVRLKPREVAVHARLFMGVFTGSEVVEALLSYFTQSVGAAVDSPASIYKVLPTQERFEAIVVAQELVTCGLLIPLASGFKTITDSETSRRPQSPVQFVDSTSSVYRLVARSANAVNTATGTWILFGSLITLSVTAPITSTKALASDSLQSGKTSHVNSLNDSLFNSSSYNQNQDQAHQVEYLVTVCHGGDEWVVKRREDQFATLHKQLSKLGINPPIQYPNRAGSVLGFSFGSSIQEEAAVTGVKLANYLNATLRHLVGNVEGQGSGWGNGGGLHQSQTRAQALRIAAEFLDDDIDRLLLH